VAEVLLNVSSGVGLDLIAGAAYLVIPQVEDFAIVGPLQQRHDIGDEKAAGLAVGRGDRHQVLAAHPSDFIMVDAFDDELRGGTGRIADWEFARAASRDLPGLFLAGGLSPANVGEAIAKVGPKAVDACSSLETEPGRKSAARMKEFVDAVRSSKLPDEI